IILNFKCYKLGINHELIDAPLTRVRRWRAVGPGTENVALHDRQRKRRAPAALLPNFWKALVGCLGSAGQPSVGQISGEGAKSGAAWRRNSWSIARLDLMR